MSSRPTYLSAKNRSLQLRRCAIVTFTSMRKKSPLQQREDCEIINDNTLSFIWSISTRLKCYGTYTPSYKAINGDMFSKNIAHHTSIFLR
mmetsp:Transcript_9901/g.17342  ORF Transcript_9901/g.17342 Transcript_9901/m.17342 type:complete len:90 (+) Transcript_9901:429-698(+)